MKISTPSWFSSFWGRGSITNSRFQGLQVYWCEWWDSWAGSVQNTGPAAVIHWSAAPTKPGRLFPLCFWNTELRGVRCKGTWPHWQSLSLQGLNEIWVTLILLIWASFCKTVLYSYPLHPIFGIFLDIWQLTCFYFRHVLSTGFVITKLSCSIF